jgi:hypothetical protein
MIKLDELKIGEVNKISSMILILFECNFSLDIGFITILSGFS